MTHWPRRQINIFTACRIQSNANDQITLSLSSETLPAALRPTYSGLFIRSNNDQASLASGLAVWRDWGGKSAYRVIRRLRMKPIGVERLSEPLCPELDVRPFPFPMLTLHLPVSHLRRRIFCCHLCGPSWIECDLCQISLPYAYLTMDFCSYQYEEWCSMDRLYMPKNLWVNHSTRLWCVCNWTLFYSLQREMHLNKLEKTKNPNRIQINCSWLPQIS